MENCSRETQEFYIVIKVPKFIQDSIVQKELTAKEIDLITDKKFVLHSRERKIINAEFIGDLVDKNNNFNGSFSDFDITLKGEKEEVKFIK